MTWPTATRKDHERFCENEGWRHVRDARVTYELALSDGRVLRTRISHPVDRSDYGLRLWSHVVRDQLHVSETEFWACAHDGRRPPRSAGPPSTASLPADLVHLLINRVGLADAEVAAMTRKAAIERVQRYWTAGS